jgi:prepilin-type N-terminal cleavage/methylation domain-containing protein
MKTSRAMINGTRNTQHRTRSKEPAIRFTLHAPRSTSPAPRSRPAFTLIELLVVIAIMSILAALIIPIGKAVNRTKIRSKARAELAMLEMAIENYKTKMGHYPPDNPDNPRLNPLYFELEGSVLTNGVFQTLDGSGQVRMSQLPITFGPKVTGIINSSQPGVGDEARPALKFISDLKPSQTVLLETGKVDRAYIIASSVPWPADLSFPLPNHPGVNPFRYNSSSPTNNPNSFDLWIDVIIDGKTNRISNWSREPIIVGTP